MIIKRTIPAFILFFLLLALVAGAQEGGLLPRSTPEAEGVSSRGILRFLDAAAKSNCEFQSFMFLRHGKVIAEGWWSPYQPDLKHTLYSVSKSFTATAIGFAVSENRLKVNDKVISFFPTELPDTISPLLADLKISDLLTMSAGQDPEPTVSIIPLDNWAKAFLSTPVVNKPGSKFLYNSAASYMLSAIIQKVTGQKEIDYLRSRLFEPLGIDGADWEIDPMGINTGGWGLRVKTEDMARFGQLFLQKGVWNNKQIIPAEWIEEASTIKILQNPGLSEKKRNKSDWQQGYCYQMWRCRYNAFRGDGAYGQLIIILPDQDAVIAVTAETRDIQGEVNLLWKYLLPAMHTGPLPADPGRQTKLKEKLTALALPLPKPGNVQPVASQIQGKTFIMEPNDRSFRNMSISFSEDVCYLTIGTATADYRLPFGRGSWQTGETLIAGPTLFNTSKNLFSGLPAFKVAGSYGWKDAYTLEMVLRYIESPHHETLTIHFDQNKISVEIRNSNDPQGKKTVITGECRN